MNLNRIKTSKNQQQIQTQAQLQAQLQAQVQVQGSTNINININSQLLHNKNQQAVTIMDDIAEIPTHHNNNSNNNTNTNIINNTNSNGQLNMSMNTLKASKTIKASTAAKFYKPQLDKFKNKSGLLIVDPHLRTKAINI